MTIEELAGRVLEACEEEHVEHMLTGAFAHGLYGIPRSTKDVDVVLSLMGSSPLQRVVRRLSEILEFESQVQFDTLTRGQTASRAVIFQPPIQSRIVRVIR